MFMDLIEFPIVSERLKWEARMVVRDLDHEPHLLIRIKISGTHFQLRALAPFVSVGKVRSRFVTIADDGLSACAYFDQPLPARATIEFGYGGDTFLRFHKLFDSGAFALLDQKRIPKNTKFTERFFGQTIA